MLVLTVLSHLIDLQLLVGSELCLARTPGQPTNVSVWGLLFSLGLFSCTVALKSFFWQVFYVHVVQVQEVLTGISRYEDSEVLTHDLDCLECHLVHFYVPWDLLQEVFSVLFTALVLLSNSYQKLLRHYHFFEGFHNFFFYSISFIFLGYLGTFDKFWRNINTHFLLKSWSTKLKTAVIFRNIYLPSRIAESSAAAKTLWWLSLIS